VNAAWIPTLLSVSRIFFAPWVVPRIIAGEHQAAFGLLLIAGSTDFFDGYLARRFHWESRTGAWADAVSDKILLSCVYISLAIHGTAPWWLVWLIFGRDLLILGMAGFALAFTTLRDFPPSVWGKLSTNVQIAAAAALLMAPHTAGPPLVWLCSATTAWSGLHYFYNGIRRLRAVRVSAI
jgi:cardiolipin synthase